MHTRSPKAHVTRAGDVASIGESEKRSSHGNGEHPDETGEHGHAGDAIPEGERGGK